MTENKFRQRISEEFKDVYPDNDPAWGTINEVANLAEEHFNEEWKHLRNEIIELRNERMDNEIEISRLKSENKELREQIEGWKELERETDKSHDRTRKEAEKAMLARIEEALKHSERAKTIPRKDGSYKDTFFIETRRIEEITDKSGTGKKPTGKEDE